MALREVTYTDPDGRHWRVAIPADEPDEAAVRGVPVGPPDLRSLGLPIEAEIRLHNELYVRGLLTERDVKHNRQALVSAVMAWAKVDAGRLYRLFAGED